MPESCIARREIAVAAADSTIGSTGLNNTGGVHHHIQPTPAPTTAAHQGRIDGGVRLHRRATAPHTTSTTPAEPPEISVGARLAKVTNANTPMVSFPSNNSRNVRDGEDVADGAHHHVRPTPTPTTAACEGCIDGGVRLRRRIAAPHATSTTPAELTKIELVARLAIEKHAANPMVTSQANTSLSIDNGGDITDGAHRHARPTPAPTTAAREGRIEGGVRLRRRTTAPRDANPWPDDEKRPRVRKGTPWRSPNGRVT
jgi:hypothetical protein